VPVLCDLKPSGRYVATDLHKAGGVPLVMKILLEKIIENKQPADVRVVDPLTRVTKENVDEFGKNWEKWLAK